jgi:diacylglycerol kinase (ATP)
MSRRPILFLANPTSGGKVGSGQGLDDDPARLTPEALRDALRDRGLTVELHTLEQADDIAALVRGGADAGRDVVVAGGDGTVSAAATELLNTPEAALGILATGSFNNMAHGFGVPATLDAALDVIGRGSRVAIDCGWVVRDGQEGGPFFEAVGIGLESLGFLAAEVAERRGMWRAARAVWRGLRARTSTLTITVDGREQRARTFAITVSNGPYHGPGFAVSPDADPTDGLLDVAIFSGMSRWEVIRHLIAVARRQPRDERRVVADRGRRVTVQGGSRALPAHADGISIGVTPVTLEVRPGALRVFR